MYIYEIGYWSMEECPVHTLCCEKQYSKEQFDELVSDCIIRVFKQRSEDALKKYRIEEIYLEDSVDYLYSDAIDILTKEFGFKSFEIHAKFIPFGWASIRDKSSWKNERDEQLNLITDKLTKKMPPESEHNSL